VVRRAAEVTEIIEPRMDTDPHRLSRASGGAGGAGPVGPWRVAWLSGRSGGDGGGGVERVDRRLADEEAEDLAGRIPT